MSSLPKGQMEQPESPSPTPRSTGMINPQRMREGYSSHSVCICVSVTIQTTFFFIKFRCHYAFCAVFNVCIV